MQFITKDTQICANYDGHFITTESGYDTKSISVIPNTEEKFILFSKYIRNNFVIRFIDTLRFMSSSLENLTRNLATPDLSNFQETAKIFSVDDLKLIIRKGVYPYEYTDSWEKLDGTEISPRLAFFSKLKEETIDEEEYQHLHEVWNHFQCKSLDKYIFIYIYLEIKNLILFL